MPPSELIDALPEQARGAFRAAYPETPSDPAELRTRIGSHAAETHSAANRNDAVDLSLSLRIAQRLEAVLKDWESLSDSHRSAIEAAIVYYALNDDGTDDLETLAGFEDDAAVVNAVLAFVGRADLQIKFA